MKNKKLNGFEQREQVSQFGYWEDPRWEQVINLRKQNKIPESNGLVMVIRGEWGVD